MYKPISPYTLKVSLSSKGILYLIKGGFIFCGGFYFRKVAQCFETLCTTWNNLTNYLSHSGSPEILAFGSHCLANFQPSLDCFIPNFKYENSQNIKADPVKRVVVNLHQIKRRAFLLGWPPVEIPINLHCLLLVYLFRDTHHDEKACISFLTVSLSQVKLFSL